MAKIKKPSLSENINEFVDIHYSDYKNKILLADGFDGAFIGVGENINGNPVAIYSIDKCLDILEEQFSEEDDPETQAVDYFEFNVRGCYVGEFTPMFIHTF
jgi:hypothetical protein